MDNDFIPKGSLYITPEQIEKASNIINENVRLAKEYKDRAEKCGYWDKSAKLLARCNEHIDIAQAQRKIFDILAVISEKEKKDLFSLEKEDNPQPITEQEFERRFGFKPENDDLERVNCTGYEIGHFHCGVCETHDQPRFRCGCLRVPYNKKVEE